jgi:hypothetical protein
MANGLPRVTSSSTSGPGGIAYWSSTICRVRDSSDPRLAELRAAVGSGDEVLVAARARGWAVETHKDHVLRLPQPFPGSGGALAGCGRGARPRREPVFSRLLGTGGNLGRLDLSATYLQRVKDVLEDGHSVAWLASLLDGQARARLPRSSLSQFQPASAGNPEDAGEIHFRRAGLQRGRGESDGGVVGPRVIDAMGAGRCRAVARGGAGGVARPAGPVWFGHGAGDREPRRGSRHRGVSAARVR